MILSDQDVDRIASAVVAKLEENARMAVDIHRAARGSAEDRKELSRQCLARAKKAAA